MQVSETPAVGCDQFLPYFAPLSAPFVAHLGEHLGRGLPFATVRASVATVLSPFARLGLATAELQRFLQGNSPTKQRIPVQTVSAWHKRGLLRYRQWGILTCDSAAAVLMMRMIHPSRKGWLPTTVSPDEPSWWCFRQDAPGAPVVACPVPLPGDLSPDTLLWTPWAGATWDDPAWLRVGPLGSIRFAGTGRTRGRRVDRAHLERWEPLILSVAPVLGVTEADDLVIETLAHLALLRRARIIFASK